MDERDIAVVAVMLPTMIIVGGVVVMVWGASATPPGGAELEHEERMAMIERGMTPPEPGRSRRARAPARHGFKLSFGILLCGLGLGLLMLITFGSE